jgi:hypothetical protein
VSAFKRIGIKRRKLAAHRGNDGRVRIPLKSAGDSDLMSATRSD